MVTIPGIVTILEMSTIRKPITILRSLNARALFMQGSMWIVKGRTYSFLRPLITLSTKSQSSGAPDLSPSFPQVAPKLSLTYHPAAPELPQRQRPGILIIPGMVNIIGSAIKLGIELGIENVLWMVTIFWVLTIVLINATYLYYNSTRGGGGGGTIIPPSNRHFKWILQILFLQGLRYVYGVPKFETPSS